MSQDQPHLGEIIRSVREFVDDLAAKVGSADRYNTLCASYLLGVAERELAHGASQEREECLRLQRFTGIEGGTADPVATLCAEIRAGRCDDRWEETLELVLQGVIDRVQISKPECLDPMHRD